MRKVVTLLRIRGRMRSVEIEVKKEPYEKPKLTVIELRAEEVLASGCKTAAPLSGPVPPACLAGEGCFADGS
jgi:hypothetical protein